MKGRYDVDKIPWATKFLKDSPPHCSVNGGEDNKYSIWSISHSMHFSFTYLTEKTIPTVLWPA